DVAHEDEQRYRQQGVVGHHPVGALDDQVEGPVVVPVLAGHPERDVPEDHAQAHQRERGGEAHHDGDHDEPEHGEAEGGIAHGLLCSTALRWRAASSIACAPSIAMRRDSSSTYSLLPSWVWITSISSTSSSRAGHCPVLRHTTQRTISQRPCSMTRMPATGMT